MSESAASLDIRLTCRPGKSGTRLVFPYAVENHGGVPVYVADAMSVTDPETQQVHVTDQWAVIIKRGAADVAVGKYLAPLPPDRQPPLPTMPLVAVVEPGGKLERTLEVPLPLAETSPYLPDPTIRHYEIVDLQAVIFAVSYWPANVPGLFAAPAEDSPGLLMIAARNPTAAAKVVSQRFPTTGLQLFKRTDAFPR